ncbi:MAG TPA: tetratricopeptide repeat protein [Streptosporangiaceae bacterium]
MGDIAEPVGRLLRRFRLTAGLTQEELAYRSGLSVRALSDIERNQTARPFSRSIRLLADALQLDDADRVKLLRAVPERPGQAAPAPLTTAGASGAEQPAGFPDVPRQLPAVVAGFAGRAAELAELNESLNLRHSPCQSVIVSAIGGIAGVGKTALAVWWAQQRAAQFPDGQLYVNLRGFDPGGAPVSPVAAIGGFLQALGLPAERIPVQPEAKAGLYRSVTAGKRILLLLDNARDSEQVIPLLPGGPGCLTLVTSRAPLTGLVTTQGARQVIVDVLSPEDARQLLALRLGDDQVAGEPVAVREVLELTGRLPLALSIVAARASACHGRPLAALAAELRDERSRLDALDAGELSADLRATFSWSWQQLSTAGRVMLRLLGIHPGPAVSVAAAASLAATRRPQARRALAELTSAGLLSEPVPGRFACHDLVRSYAAELSLSQDIAGDRSAATRRMLDHYLHSAAAARQLITSAPAPASSQLPASGTRPEQPGGYEQAMGWFATERPVLVTVLASAVRAGFDDYAQQLTAMMATYLGRCGQWEERLDVMVVGLAAAQREADVAAQGSAHRLIGGALVQLGRPEDGRQHLRQALKMFAQTGDREGAGRSHLAIAVTFGEQRRFSDALEHARQALAIFSQATYGNEQAQALNIMGWALTELGDHKQAIGRCRQALALCADTGNRVLAANTRDTLGQAYYNSGQRGHALDCYRQSAAECHELGHLWGEADALSHLGTACFAGGEVDAAREAWQQALIILEDRHHPGADKIRASLRQLGG